MAPIPLPDILLSGRPETPERAAAYGLLDRMLRDVGPITVADLIKDDLGRPYCPSRPGLSVSVAHTDGAVAAAVSTEGRVGIDVEAATLYDPIVGDLVLTPAQRASIESAEKPDDLFLRLWTRKEAIGKALGVGIEKDVLACAAENDTVFLREIRFRVSDLRAPTGCHASLAIEQI
ncbi:MAG: 4'-phosphopantetheinyl transferase superfamily protein [Proteobacteria bacterium]|nr:4'-phosphopantetheinyl transferase superfamily protein [Pseudomonadota bacterium]